MNISLNFIFLLFTLPGPSQTINVQFYHSGLDVEGNPEIFGSAIYIVTNEFAASPNAPILTIERPLLNLNLPGNIIDSVPAPLNIGTYKVWVKVKDFKGNESTWIQAANYLDREPPAAPQSLTGNAIAFNQVNLVWETVQDDISTYSVYRSGILLATVENSNYLDLAASASSRYNYSVSAIDNFNNESELSPSIEIITPNAPIPAPSAGLVASYGFENSGVLVTDLSGSNNIGTIFNGASLVSGKFGNALKFNGSNQYIEIQDSNSLDFTNAFTISYWTNPTVQVNDWKCGIQKEPDVFFLSVQTPNGGPGLGATINGSVSYIQSTNKLPINTWTYVTGRYDGSTFKIFINGAEIMSQSQTGSLTNNNLPVRIGGNLTYSAEYFNGSIDNVRIYNRALSSQEIVSDMNIAVGTIAKKRPGKPNNLILD